MLLPLLFSLSAHALDLDLSVRLQGQEAVAVTLRDVEPGMVPGLLIPGPDRVSHRVLVDLVDQGQDVYSFDIRLERIESRKGGREQVELLMQPRLTAELGEPAMVSAGTRTPISEGGEVAFTQNETRFDLRLYDGD